MDVKNPFYMSGEKRMELSREHISDPELKLAMKAKYMQDFIRVCVFVLKSSQFDSQNIGGQFGYTFSIPFEDGSHKNVDFDIKVSVRDAQ